MIICTNRDEPDIRFKRVPVTDSAFLPNTNSTRVIFVIICIRVRARDALLLPLCRAGCGALSVLLNSLLHLFPSLFRKPCGVSFVLSLQDIQQYTFCPNFIHAVAAPLCFLCCCRSVCSTPLQRLLCASSQM